MAKKHPKEEKKQDTQPEAEREQKKPSSDTNTEATLTEYKHILQRLQADFENYKKRVEKEQHQQNQKNKHFFIASILPVIDSFELALQNTEDAEAFKQGIELLYAQFYGLLESQGLKKIEAVGQPLDPYKHDVMMKEKGKQDNIIIEEFQKGYAVEEAVIRHSKVKVSILEEEKNV